MQPGLQNAVSIVIKLAIGKIFKTCLAATIYIGQTMITVATRNCQTADLALSML